MITTVLFDLDGTLLPMDQERFAHAYFGGLARKAAEYGYSVADFSAALKTGIASMIKNNGERTNEEAFWSAFSGSYGMEGLKETAAFDDFYETEFPRLSDICGYNPSVPELIEKIKSSGLRVAVATNPLFPRAATDMRIKWAGLAPSDFELYTTYENSSYCKPNPCYYKAVLEKLGVESQECIMVGNDTDDDLSAESIGIKVFFLTDCLINKKCVDISSYPHGDVYKLAAYISKEAGVEKGILLSEIGRV